MKSILSYLILSYLISSYLTLPYPILTLSYLILSYLTLPYPILTLSYLILSSPTLSYLIFSNLIHLFLSYFIFSYLIFLFSYHPQPPPPWADQSFQRLWTNDRLLNLMEQILGPEVAGHPVWNLRTKTPRSEAVNIPWHQGKGR